MTQSEFADRLAELIDEARQNLDDEVIVSEMELRIYALEEEGED